jgi:hypothetical protein
MRIAFEGCESDIDKEELKYIENIAKNFFFYNFLFIISEEIFQPPDFCGYLILMELTSF